MASRLFPGTIFRIREKSTHKEKLLKLHMLFPPFHRPAITGPSCWFEDEMVVNIDTTEKIRKEGTTFDEFANIARKHADVDAYKASESSLEYFIGQLTRINSSFDPYMVASYSRKRVNQHIIHMKTWLLYWMWRASSMKFIGFPESSFRRP